MDSQVQTQEYARNPDAEVLVKCPRCRRECAVADFVKEEPLPTPYETVVEGFIKCPSCSYKKHSYYMSEKLRFDQQRLSAAVKKWHASKQSADYRVYIRLFTTYQREYDEAQRRYTALFKKREKSREQTKA